MLCASSVTLVFVVLCFNQLLTNCFDLSIAAIVKGLPLLFYLIVETSLWSVFNMRAKPKLLC